MCQCVLWNKFFFPPNIFTKNYFSYLATITHTHIHTYQDQPVVLTDWLAEYYYQASIINWIHHHNHHHHHSLTWLKFLNFRYKKRKKSEKQREREKNIFVFYFFIFIFDQYFILLSNIVHNKLRERERKRKWTSFRFWLYIWNTQIQTQTHTHRRTSSHKELKTIQ